MQLLHALDTVTIIWGLMVGSFLNVLAWRLPEGEGFVRGRSHCRSCERTLVWWELIPVLSYVLLRGRCHTCHARVSLQYPLVELASGLLFWGAFRWVLAAGPDEPGLAFAAFLYLCFIGSILIVTFVTDLRHFLILDALTYPASAATLGLIAVNRMGGCPIAYLPCSASAFIASLAGAAFFLVLVAGSRGRWMGWGDVKLALLMGLVLGPWKLLVAFLVAFLSGSVVGLGLILARRKTLTSEVPFGVFLVPATFIAFVWGEPILRTAGLLPFRW